MHNTNQAFQKLEEEQYCVTDFQKKVYRATILIPPGKVTTYKLISELLKCNSSQAVGQALKRNPLAPLVPCHRVISTDLTVGGFQGRRSGERIQSKLRLLESEGVTFCNDKLADENMLFKFEV